MPGESAVRRSDNYELGLNGARAAAIGVYGGGEYVPVVRCDAGGFPVDSVILADDAPTSPGGQVNRNPDGRVSARRTPTDSLVSQQPLARAGREFAIRRAPDATAQRFVAQSDNPSR